MKTSKKILSELDLRFKKTLKLDYQFNIFKTLLIKHQFICFYFIDFVSSESLLQLQNILVKNNLKKLQIKKKLLNSFNIESLQPLLLNNIFIIYSQNPSEKFPFEINMELNSIKNIYCLGLYLTNFFLRPTEIKLWSACLVLNVKQILYNLLKIYQKTLLKNFSIYKLNA